VPAVPVFADSFYWVALFNARDPWHVTVRQFSTTLAGRLLVTSDEVLAEVLAWFATGGPAARVCRTMRP
jgi:predicted nucleic acid-binding protein